MSSYMKFYFNMLKWSIYYQLYYKKKKIRTQSMNYIHTYTHIYCEIKIATQSCNILTFPTNYTSLYLV